MSLIDSSYFINDCNLPATRMPSTAIIARYERDILIQILGYDLAKLVIAYTSMSEQRILDLVDGKEYIEGSHTVSWNGLLNADKVSILSYYVFIQYLLDKSISYLGAGSVASNVENGVNVGPSQLIQRASANMVSLIGYNNQDVYAPSLYNYMAKHYTVYPEWIFGEVKTLNMFGI